MSKDRKGIEVIHISGTRYYPEADKWEVDSKDRLNIYEGTDVIAVYQAQGWKMVCWTRDRDKGKEGEV